MKQITTALCYTADLIELPCSDEAFLFVLEKTKEEVISKNAFINQFWVETIFNEIYKAKNGI